jgi:hypothetical protein
MLVRIFYVNVIILEYQRRIKLPKVKQMVCKHGKIHFFGDRHDCDCKEKHKPTVVFSRMLGIAFKLPKRKEKK